MCAMIKGKWCYVIGPHALPSPIWEWCERQKQLHTVKVIAGYIGNSTSCTANNSSVLDLTVATFSRPQQMCLFPPMVMKYYNNRREIRGALKWSWANRQNREGEGCRHWKPCTGSGRKQEWRACRCSCAVQSKAQAQNRWEAVPVFHFPLLSACSLHVKMFSAFTFTNISAAKLRCHCSCHSQQPRLFSSANLSAAKLTLPVPVLISSQLYSCMCVHVYVMCVWTIWVRAWIHPSSPPQVLHSTFTYS